jgi:hypothetical protein
MGCLQSTARWHNARVIVLLAFDAGNGDAQVAKLSLDGAQAL